MSVLGAIGEGIGIASDIANTVLGFQNQQYMKGVQEKTWEREDTAIQRRVADLKASGLSPVLAAGSGASTSSPINVGVPQFSGQNAMRALEYESAKKQQAVTEAQKRLIEQQIDATEANAFPAKLVRDYLVLNNNGADFAGKVKGYDLADSMVRRIIADNDKAVVDSKAAGYNAALAASAGVPLTTGSLDAVGQGKLIDNMLKNPSAGAGPLASVIKALSSVFK